MCYEVGRQLEAQNQRAVLFLLDGRAPHYESSYLQYDIDALAMCVLCRGNDRNEKLQSNHVCTNSHSLSGIAGAGAKQFLGFDVEVSYTEIAPLSPDQRLLNVVEKVMEKNGLDLISPAVGCNFFFRFQKDIKESELMCRRYSPQTKFAGPVVLFRTTGKNDIEGVDDPVLYSRTLNWDRFCGADIAVVDCEGDHESIAFQPSVQGLALKIRDSLNQYLHF